MSLRQEFNAHTCRIFDTLFERARKLDGHDSLVKATKGRPFSQVIVDDVALSFMSIMQEIPEAKVPIDFYKHLIEKGKGVQVTRTEAKENFSTALKVGPVEDREPQFFEALKEAAVPQKTIAEMAQLWMGLLSYMGRLPSSEITLSATNKANSALENFAYSLEFWQEEQQNGNNLPVVIDPKQDNNRPEDNNKDKKQDQTEKAPPSGVTIHKAEDIGSVDDAMESLVGMEAPKQQIALIRARVQLEKAMKNAGMAPKKERARMDHYVFKGDPGTGKTTFARMIGSLYKEAGLLESGHVVEAGRSAIVGKYIGHTAPLVEDIIDAAKDGVLFLDEAYMLLGEGNDFGPEAMGTLLKGMEVNKDRLVVVIAGYPDLMGQLLHSNPGLESRFPHNINFPNFETVELMEIFDRNMDNLNLQLEDGQRERVAKLLELLKSSSKKTFGNARTVENIVDNLKDAHSAVLAEKGVLQQIAEHQNRGVLRDVDIKAMVTVTSEAVDKVASKYTSASSLEKPKPRIGFFVGDNHQQLEI